MMKMFREIYKEYEDLILSIKMPAIHWKDNRNYQGLRETEKRTGLIGNNGDEDYQKIFELA